jgi:hypothetical protein
VSLFNLFGRQPIQSVPHPELVPLTEEECTISDTAKARLHLSELDYSQDEIDQAIAEGNVPGDMRQYCHNNGIAWEVQVCTRRK